MERPSSPGEVELTDHLEALGSVRTGRSVFAILVLLALLSQMGSYCAVRFGRVLAVQPSAAAGPATQAAAAPAEPTRQAVAWQQTIRMLVPLAQFVGLVSALLLAVSLLVGLNVSLAGRLGGAGRMTSAFFWSVLLLALLFPWQQLLAGGAMPVPGVFYGMAELERVAQSRAMSLAESIAEYARYLAYPVLAVLIGLLASVRFGRGCQAAEQRLRPAGPEPTG
ncbi:MAG: hypothetical protein ACE5K7_00370 [Phycisphaerae bacterium]